MNPELMSKEESEWVAPVTGYMTEVSDIRNNPNSVTDNTDNTERIDLTEQELEEQLLIDGVVVSMREIGGGMNHPLFVKFEGGAGIFKPMNRENPKYAEGMEGTLYKRERAAYIVDKTLGFNLIPPTVIREIDGQIGSIQKYIDGAKVAASSSDKGDLEDQKRMWIMDLINRNTDRMPGNYMVKDGLVIAIDNGSSFSTTPDWSYYSFFDEEIPNVTIDNLVNFISSAENINNLKNSLQETLNENEIDATVSRLLTVTGLLKEYKQIPTGSFSK